jgi:hypothetical protein
MGLLDDAIREHLELKRQHGADPDEVARQEREALGSARGGEPAEPLAPAAAPEPESEPAPEPHAEAAPADELPAGEPAEPEEPSAGHVAGAPGYDEDPWLEEEPAAPPAEPEPDTSALGEAPSEDVLEETPDFLQETPEHDRLWFEQKPPRDFDWDS